jgi:nucleotide-binding universal stress UspA family protein
MYLEAENDNPKEEATMYQNILLCTDGSPAANVAADAAVWFAQKLAARLRALYVTDLRVLEGPWLADLAGAIGAQPYAALVPQLQTIQREKAAAILDAVGKKCETHAVPFELVHETGNLIPTLLQHERAADIIVLGQRGEHAPWSGQMLGSSVERMVRASVKPALITPDSFHPVQRILIAYDGSRGAQKALHDGLELAEKLRAEVFLMTACQRDTEESASTLLHEALQQATDRHLNAHAQLAHGDAETQILHWATQTQSDLIVMGAYGHTRIREFFLGSTTHHVLRKTTIPVLLTRA